LIGIPLVGLMIDRFTWRSPFVAMGCLAALSFVAVSWLIPRDGRGRHEAAEQPGVKEIWRQAKRNPAVLAALGFALLMSLANDTLFVIYGVWLESTFSLSVVALGLSTMVIGVAELLGEGLTATVSDRLGLRQSLLIGMSFVVLTYLLLPLGETSLVLALGALFLAFLSFEFTVVTSFAYVSEIFPQARAVMMSSTLAAASIGRITGALIGGSLWLAGGMRANSLIAALAALLALTCVAVMTRRVGEKARPA
jgi:predicted MFS family arabinose efflux permease